MATAKVRQEDNPRMRRLRSMPASTRLAVAIVAAGFAAVACDSATYQYPTKRNRDSAPRYGYGETRVGDTSVFGDGGLFGSRGSTESPGGGGIGVNSFLWRASLDSISFMPLASADPFGGVIVTDWHSLPEAPDERFKVNVFILGRELRADGVKAAVFRQRRDTTGNWADVAVEERTVRGLEDAILSKARELRLANQPTR